MGKTSSAVKHRYNNKVYTKFQCEIKNALYEEVQTYIDAEGISKAQFLERAIQALKPE